MAEPSMQDLLNAIARIQGEVAQKALDGKVDVHRAETASRLCRSRPEADEACGCPSRARELAMTDIPEGWTDEMSIALPSGSSHDEVVDVLLRLEANKAAPETIGAELLRLGLTEEDALLAHDRTLGGLVRAATQIQ